jgi:hypothetical protein
MTNRGMPTARLCEVCHKPKGVTFHVLFVNGKGKSIQAHTACFLKLRRQQERP